MKKKRKRVNIQLHFLLLFTIISCINYVWFSSKEGIPIVDQSTTHIHDNFEDFSNFNISSWKPVFHRQWCRANNNKHNKPGLIYMKIPKTGSSTLAGINIRLARKIGQRTLHSSFWNWFQNGIALGVPSSSSVCAHTFTHGRKALLERHDQTPNILWSFVRDPAQRALSEFYHFEVSRKGTPPKDATLRVFLRKKRNTQFLYLADHPQPESLLYSKESWENPPEYMIYKYVLRHYDFIGLLERKEESLVVLKMLWNLNMEDLIVLSAKTSGGYDDGRFNGTCIPIQKAPSRDAMSSMVTNYLTHDFPSFNHDYTLYRLVNDTLDKTIQELGVEKVNYQVQQLRMLQQLADSSCQDLAIFPCSSNGTLQLEAAAHDCYWTDSGCGHACVDRVLQTN